MLMNTKTVIVGAGIGGLATAARLAHDGHEVTVLEKLDKCGGRVDTIQDRGFSFDTGPTFLLMPDFFEEVFAYCGEHISTYLRLQELDISYKIFYPDGTAFTVYQSTEKTKQEIEKFEPGGAAAYDAFMKETGEIYDAVRPLLYQCHTKQSVLQPRYWKLLPLLKAHKTYWQMVQRHFNSEKLRYAFTFQAMFIGMSPFKAPGFYSMITYADYCQKIYRPHGGMYQIARALEKLARQFGARFHFNSPAARIRQSNGSVVVTTEGGDFEAGSVVLNSDYAYSISELMGRSLPEFDYSFSVYLMFLGLKRKIRGLEYHNVFFADDLKKNLQEIFNDHTVPIDPSFYVHVPTVADASLAPEGKDIAYVLIPVPNLRNRPLDRRNYEERMRRTVFTKIRRYTGVDLENLIETEYKFYPEDYMTRYNIKYGAAFGLSHSFFQSAFFRPPNFDRKIKNLYFVGASTQPGGGLPPVLASSRIVADLIKKQYPAGN